MEDFEPLGLAGSVGRALVSHPDFEANSREEFLALARAKPGILTYASSGIGSPQHVGMKMLKCVAGIGLVHVPCQGAHPATTDVIGSHIDVTVDPIPSAMPHVGKYSAKGLAVTTAEPSDFLPGLPTVASAGMRDCEVRSWCGILAPCVTPEEVTQRVTHALSAPQKNQKVIKVLKATGYDRPR